MKNKILNHPFIRWAVNLPPCKWAASHPIFSRFCNYEIISYLVCGVMTTLVDYVSYFIGKKIGLNTAASTTFAWILAVIFAYFVNKIFVFFSTDWTRTGLLKEIIPFLSCRVFSYIMNVVLMVLTVDFLHLNEPLMKIVANVLVMIANYFGSKFVVFRNKK